MSKYTCIFVILSFALFGKQKASCQVIRTYLGVNNSFSSGYFYSGSTLQTGNPNVEFSNYQNIYINSKSSLDWSDESLNMSFFESLGRRYHLNLGIDYFFSKRLSACIGYELGARSFSVYGDDKIIAFRNIRTHSIPIIFSHYTNLSKNTYLKKSSGFSLNIPISKNQSSSPVNTYETKSYSPLYLLFNIGLDFEYRFKNNNAVSIGLSYNQGFINIINDKINYDVRFKDNQKLGYGSSSVFSNGSHWLFGMKYAFNFSQKKSNIKQKSSTNVDLNKREISTPFEIIVDSSIIKICVFDLQTVDGDSVSLEFKDSIVFENIRLDKSKKCVSLKIEPNQPNYLVIHALNEGRIKPNTVSLIIDDGKKEEIINIKTTLLRSGAINFILK